MPCHRHDATSRRAPAISSDFNHLARHPDLDIYPERLRCAVAGPYLGCLPHGGHVHGAQCPFHMMGHVHVALTERAWAATHAWLMGAPCKPGFPTALWALGGSLRGPCNAAVVRGDSAGAAPTRGHAALLQGSHRRGQRLGVPQHQQWRVPLWLCHDAGAIQHGLQVSTAVWVVNGQRGEGAASCA